MNKKILSIFFLLIIITSIAFVYSYFSQNSDENQYDISSEHVSNVDIAGEIDDMFLEEDEEVEIGEMV